MKIKYLNLGFLGKSTMRESQTRNRINYHPHRYLAFSTLEMIWFPNLTSRLKQCFKISSEDVIQVHLNSEEDFMEITRPLH